MLTRAEWILFQTHCYSENLAAPGIEPEPSVLAGRNSNHSTTEVVINVKIVLLRKKSKGKIFFLVKQNITHKTRYEARFLMFDQHQRIQSNRSTFECISVELNSEL
jgi:hypothetical protein